MLLTSVCKRRPPLFYEAHRQPCDKLNPMPRGYFITFEGLDGSGKTTQLHLLRDHLLAAGHHVVTTRQPGGTPLGDRIRSLLVSSSTEQTLGPVNPLAELALMFADRAQSIAEVILPALAAGYIVLCDRFTDSSEAYQGGGRQLDSAPILTLHRTLCHDLQPDLTLLLLPPLASSLRRARSRNRHHLRKTGTDENRFERESDNFYTRIRDTYLAIAAREPHRVVLIESDAGIDTIKTRIADIVSSRLPAPVPSSK